LINLLVVTHGEFGAYLIEAAESIVGRQTQGVRSIAVSPRQSVTELRARIARAMDELASPDGLIVMTDIPGGTPNNLTFPLLKERQRVEMVSGINLYMLISAFANRGSSTLQLLVDKIVVDGQKSIRDMRRLFLTATR